MIAYGPTYWNYDHCKWWKMRLACIFAIDTMKGIPAFPIVCIEKKSQNQLFYASFYGNCTHMFPLCIHHQFIKKKREENKEPQRKQMRLRMRKEGRSGERTRIDGWMDGGIKEEKIWENNVRQIQINTHTHTNTTKRFMNTMCACMYKYKNIHMPIYSIYFDLFFSSLSNTNRK